MAEVALAVLLVVGGGPLLRSFPKLMEGDAGFNRTRMTTFGIVLPNSDYRAAQSRVDFFTRLIAQLTQLPGVTGAAAMTRLPPNRDVNANDVDFVSYVPPKEGPFENVDYFQTVTLDYLQTMGIPVVEGRGFERTDVTGGAVVLVNETLARTFFKDRPVLGQRVDAFAANTPVLFTIVGVVR